MYPTRTTSYSTKYLYDDDEAEIHLCHTLTVCVWVSVWGHNGVYVCVCVSVGEWALELQLALERQVCHAYFAHKGGQKGVMRGEVNATLRRRATGKGRGGGAGWIYGLGAGGCGSGIN